MRFILSDLRGHFKRLSNSQHGTSASTGCIQREVDSTLLKYYNPVVFEDDAMPRSLFRKARSNSSRGLQKFLGGLELAVMEIVWEHESLTVREVLNALTKRGQVLAYTTVMTVMTRLKDKGWLTADRAGRAYRYRAVRARREAEAEAVGSVLRALLEDFGDLAVAQFVRELDEIHPGQLDRLAELAHRAGEQKDE